MIFNLIIAFIILLILLGGFIGLLMLGSSFLQKKKPSKISLILVGIPFGLLTIVLTFQVASELILSKPKQKDLIGKYHLAEVTVQDFDKSRSNQYLLEFKADGSFDLTPLPQLEDICQYGKYNVDYKLDYNEIQLDCGTFTTFAHINRGLGSYTIEFMIGDPDLGESYYFEKDKN